MSTVPDPVYQSRLLAPVPAVEAAVAAQGGPPATPTTTHQEDLVVLGQRKINLIWEYTQSFIAVSVVISNMLVCILFAVRHDPIGDYPTVLSSALFLTTGVYLQRTNHQNVGGIGPKPADRQSYEGR